MNQPWAWLITGLVTGVLAPAVVVAIRRWSSWQPPQLPATLTAALAILLHGAITVSLVVGFPPPAWAGLHLVLLAVGVGYWLPICGPGRTLDGVSRFAYTFITSPFLDLAGVVVVGLGHAEGGIAMIVGMLPLNGMAVVFAWRWLADEERSADAGPPQIGWSLPPGWPTTGAGPVDRTGRTGS